MPFRFVNLPPLVAVLEAVSGWRWRPFPPDFARNMPAAGGLSFPYCPNMVRNVPNFASFQSFYKFLPPDLAEFSVFAGFGCPRSDPSAVCRMVRAWSRGPRRRCRSPSARRSARNIGRRATPLPLPPFASFLRSSVPLAVICRRCLLSVFGGRGGGLAHIVGEDGQSLRL